MRHAAGAGNQATVNSPGSARMAVGGLRIVGGRRTVGKEREVRSENKASRAA
jgi:hypothetical protein